MGQFPTSYTEWLKKDEKLQDILDHHTLDVSPFLRAKN